MNAFQRFKTIIIITNGQSIVKKFREIKIIRETNLNNHGINFIRTEL